MTAKSMRTFADRIAAAPQENEKALFREALVLFSGGTPAQNAARWKRFMRCGAYHETAIAIYCTIFAERGFQFGPPARNAAATSSRGLASSWSAGDAHATVHRAATPALALLHAAAIDTAASLDEETAAQCSVCGGLGWFVTEANDKDICRHERGAV